MEIDENIITRAAEKWRELEGAIIADTSCSGAGCSCSKHVEQRRIGDLLKKAEGFPGRIEWMKGNLERALQASI